MTRLFLAASVWWLLVTVGSAQRFTPSPSSEGLESSGETVSAPGVASTSPALGLKEWQELAFRHNPTLAAASARRNAARGRQIQAGRYPNPVLGYHGSEIGNDGTPGQQGGFVRQRFITGGKLHLDQEAAGQTVRESGYRLLAQEQRVLTDVRVRFYEALAAQHRLEVTEELLRIGRDLVDATETLLESGQKPENDLLQAQIRADQSEILLDNARNELEEARRRLVAVVGTPHLARTTLKGDLEAVPTDLSWKRCLEAVLGGHPELNAARARAERARILISRAKREPIPDIDVSVSMRHVYPTDSDAANVQVGMPIPVFDKNRGKIMAAESEWLASRQEIKRIELDLQDRLSVVYRQYANALKQAKQYRETILPRAKRSLMLTINGYKNGQVEYLTLLTSQETFLRSNLDYLRSLQQWQTATALLEGRLLEGGLGRR
jgi:cobalt-zinc-cadmium efflux system outer membrane protein